MDPESAAIDQLRTLAGFFDACRILTYHCHRKGPSGGTQEVRIEILDAGPEAGIGRYLASALADDGRVAEGAPAPTIKGALTAVHWEGLDRDLPPGT
jgi:hypothetical protein